MVEKGEGTFASLEFQRYRSRILQLFDVYVSSSKIPPISLRLTEAEKKREREGEREKCLFPFCCLSRERIIKLSIGDG